MPTILVLGGRGFLGSRIANSLERMEHITVHRASRSKRDGFIKCDLSEPKDHEQLSEYDLIINCSDALVVDPWPAMHYCLNHGKTWVETTSEPVLVRRLIKQPIDAQWTGSVILGAGIFTGYSNMMAAQSLKQLNAPEKETSLALGIRWSPLSAGGSGMVALMTHLLNVPSAFVTKGKAQLTSDVTAGPALSYDDGNHKGLHIPFCEPTMLHHSTNATEIHAYASLTPRLIYWAFLFTPMVLLRLGIVQWLMGLQMTLLRKILLKNVETPVRMVALAKTKQTRLSLQFKAEDGMAFGADAAASQVDCILKATPRTGISTIDQNITWEALQDTLTSHAQTPWQQNTEKHKTV